MTAPLPARERLAALDAERLLVLETLCVCGHQFMYHADAQGIGCFGAIPIENGAQACPCMRFNEPDEV